MAFMRSQKKYKLLASTTRGWYEKKDKIFKFLLDPDISVKVPVKKLIAWVKDRNSRGLRVKDKFIEIKTREPCNKLRVSAPICVQSINRIAEKNQEAQKL
jgi:hypothetical protein